MTSKLKIAIPDLISPSYFPAEAAVELGCFREEGIDAELELISPVERAYAALRDGAVDIVAGSAHSALSAFPRWQGAKLLCAQSQGMYWFLVMRSDLGARRNELGVVKGRRIGAAPWVGMGLRHLLVESGMDPVRDEVVIMPTPGSLEAKVNFGVAAFQALEARLIDGFWANGMGAEIAVRSGVGTLVLDVRRGDGPPHAYNFTMATLAATDDFIASRPEAAAGAVRAIAAANRKLIEYPARAQEVGMKLFPQEAEYIVELIKRDTPFYQTRLSREFVSGMNAFARNVDILDVDVPYESVVAEQFSQWWTD
ncbi:ABC transporter substrate-binding protein [Mesorhizobium sp. B2-4-9]|uniref:ABC transporter substrate-binding protein n=1 Tax=Mesorhizobium sp. B2-4-9 TaxID=2589940 RepID=UPI0011284671|nr:ABC transporter substrate-binding protein [Mesorhizobium sp. B2-4-9]TPL23457.1 ABC transporter substrate-binding protein [Mesorhizobium sp. B2-4-9]